VRDRGWEGVGNEEKVEKKKRNGKEGEERNTYEDKRGFPQGCRKVQGSESRDCRSACKNTHGEVRDRGWEVVRRVLEIYAQGELRGFWRQVVDRVVERESECEVRDAQGEVVDFLIETVREEEVGEVGREVVYWLVETVSKGEVSEAEREVVHAFVECIAEREMSTRYKEKRKEGKTKEKKSAILE
jgi:hypothetical protein